MRVCSEPGCGEIAEGYHCDDHKPKPWASSTRRQKVRSGWEQQRRARFVMLRDDGVCSWCGQAGADEVDHVIPLAEGGPDHLDNLQPIHGPRSGGCHSQKTSLEAQRGRARGGP